MKYDEMIPIIIELVGGEKNIKSLLHCSTRLRFKFYDKSKVDENGLKSIHGIAGVKSQSDGVQLIIGQDVEDVYELIIKKYQIGDASHEQTPINEEAKSKTSWFFKAMGWISDCLIPMLPALIASGLTTAVITVLKAFGVLSEESVTYQCLDAIASAVLNFIPVMVVYGTAKKLEVNPMISFAVIAALLSSDLWALAGENSDYLYLFDAVPIRVFSYASTIFPAIMCVAAQKYIQKYIKKVIPKMLTMFLEPLLTFVILVFLMLVVLGPIGAYIGDALANLIIWGAEDYKWLICFVLAGFGNFLVGSGMHYCLIPAVIMIFSQLGYDSFYGAACFAGAFALAGSVLGVSFKTKDATVKQVTTSTGITALIGVSEPAIYGVFFKYRSVMIADTIAGCISGLIAGILGCNAYGMAPAGITTVMLFAGDTFMNLIIVIATAFIIGFVLSFLFYNDQKEGAASNV